MTLHKYRLTNLAALLGAIFYAFFALSFSVKAEQKLLYDYASLLSPDEASELEDLLSEVSGKYDFDVVILTNNSLGYKSAEEYADDFFDENGFGRDEYSSGILLLVSMGERDWAISTGGKGMYIFGDRELDAIEDAVLPCLSDGEYAEAFRAFVSRVEYELERGGEVSDEEYQSFLQREYYRDGVDFRVGVGTRLTVSAAVGLIIGLISVSVMKSKMKTVRQKRTASDYTVKDSLVIARADDIFLGRHVSRTPRETEQTSHHGGGGGIHTSSSGVPHGGRSGKF